MSSKKNYHEIHENLQQILNITNGREFEELSSFLRW